jgi:alpha-tubulin suppressor-like RCC1 family protein
MLGCRSNFDELEIVALSAHGSHSCVVTAGGELWCWGSGLEGQLGVAGIDTQPRPARVRDVPLLTSIDTGEYTSFARSDHGELWAWGANDWAQLGIGVTSPSVPTPRALPVLDVSDVAAAQYSTCALRTDGTVSCWGDNRCGQLGDGTRTMQAAPILVPGLTGIRSLGVDDFGMCVVDAAGALLCWGSPSDSCTGAVLTPTAVPSVPAMTSVEGGCHHTRCAIDVGGGVWCVGEGLKGQLGNGSTMSSSTFVPVAGLGPAIVEVAVGGYHTCGRTADHHVWCWGDNQFGALGLGSPTPAVAATPLLVSFFDGSIPLEDLEAGCGHTCARGGSDIYCWGMNSHGELGDSSHLDRFAPVRVTIAP